jgi:CHAT domain-containing protein
LVVGVSEAVRDLGLPKLPEAPREVREVAAMYPVATTLVDADATPNRLTLLTASHDVFHFAGHARANLRFPALSALVLSPDQHHRTGTLTAAEIAAWQLSRARLVALSACRTAYGAVYRGEGVISLARPFLAAGVPSVVGALWDVSDTAARNLLTAFHRTYVASGDPVASLRAAQLQVLRDPSRRLRAATHWGAFTIISGVAGR